MPLTRRSMPESASRSSSPARPDLSRSASPRPGIDHVAASETARRPRRSWCARPTDTCSPLGGFRPRRPPAPRTSTHEQHPERRRWRLGRALSKRAAPDREQPDDKRGPRSVQRDPRPRGRARAPGSPRCSRAVDREAARARGTRARRTTHDQARAGAARARSRARDRRSASGTTWKTYRSLRFPIPSTSNDALTKATLISIVDDRRERRSRRRAEMPSSAPPPEPGERPRRGGDGGRDGDVERRARRRGRRTSTAPRGGRNSAKVPERWPSQPKTPSPRATDATTGGAPPGSRRLTVGRNHRAYGAASRRGPVSSRRARRPRTRRARRRPGSA